MKLGSLVAGLVIMLGVYFFTSWNLLAALGIGVVAAMLLQDTFKGGLPLSFDKDRKYIKQALKLAEKKNDKIQSYRGQWRMWKIFLKVHRIHKVNQKILETIKQHPSRFGQADKFFSLYLDSALNILEKYHVLVQQPVRTPEVQASLRHTEELLNDVISGLELEMTRLLSNEIQDLAVEKEVLEQYK